MSDMITIGRCSECDWRQGTACQNTAKIHEEDDRTTEGDDELVYSYWECGGFDVGPNFGCVHWKQKTDKPAPTVVVEPEANKCDTCTKEFATCDSKRIVWGIDRDPSARGAAADVVLECDAYVKAGQPCR
jgi:hypothetical protein